MDQAFDPLNLLLLAVAVVVFLRLRSVLGRRTGLERPPLDTTPLQRKPEAKGNVVNFPKESRDAAPAADAGPAAPVWTGYAAEGSALAAGLEAIAKADGQFTPKEFLKGARGAYEMIVTAFAEGDKAELKPLLSRDVFDGFAGAIDERTRAGEKLISRFVGIDKADITAASLAGRRASVTVGFISQMITATEDRSGAVIDGDLKQIREVSDVWTFERDTSSGDPNWRLVATEDRG